MTRTITALFDDRGDAEAAKARLTQSRVDADHILIHDKSSAGYSETGRSTHQDRGLWASIKSAFLPDTDRHTYEEGVRRGGVLLTANVEDDDVADAVRVLEEANTVDIDERSQSWRSSGWDDTSIPVGDSAFIADPSTSIPGAGVVPADYTPSYARRETHLGGSRVRSYVDDGYLDETSTGAYLDRGPDASDRAKGLANEAIGNVKQTAGGLFGKDELTREGEAQERRGEAQQGKKSDVPY